MVERRKEEEGEEKHTLIVDGKKATEAEKKQGDSSRTFKLE